MPHAAERWSDNAPLAGEERRDETPPVPVGGPAMQEYEAGLAALAPGEGLDLRAVEGDECPLRLDCDHAFEPRRRRRLLPAKGRERRHGVRFSHARVAAKIQATSNSPAAPMPPPTHIVTTT